MDLPSNKFNSSLSAVTPSNIFNSAVVDVTPSITNFSASVNALVLALFS